MQYAEFQRVERHSDGPVSWEEARTGFYVPALEVAVYRTGGGRRVSPYQASGDGPFLDELRRRLDGSEPGGWIQYDAFEVREGDEATLRELVARAEEMSGLAERIDGLITRLRE